MASIGLSMQYIRQHTRGCIPTFREEAAISDDFRCNQGASSGNETDTYTVKVGDVVGLRQAFGAGGIEHPGHTQMYLSKAPDFVKGYDCSGDWTKVHQGLVCRQDLVAEVLQTNGGWCVWGQNYVSFTLPSTIPDGEYLLRAEQIALHGVHAGKAEFYYAFDFSVWGGLTEYDYILGIDVADGGQIQGSKNGFTGDVSVDVTGDNLAVESSAQTAEAAATTSTTVAASCAMIVDASSSVSVGILSVIETSTASKLSRG
ncbi:hypothetical protein QQZ08_008685 [Neonectria magnoliae]|uniref:lytic cellulose monooxygenase (C4-dehydrogenating) n=1 Tax=Neonectria magnoliae TaxID=2732573 RepID=A0ABR1HSJ4_9HYPO